MQLPRYRRPQSHYTLPIYHRGVGVLIEPYITNRSNRFAGLRQFEDYVLLLAVNQAFNAVLDSSNSMFISHSSNGDDTGIVAILNMTMYVHLSTN